MTRQTLAAVALSIASALATVTAPVVASAASLPQVSNAEPDTASGYPDWAEKALAGKGTGGGR